MNLKAKPKLRYIFFDLFATHMEKGGILWEMSPVRVKTAIFTRFSM
jgi:hypothetical protein